MVDISTLQTIYRDKIKVTTGKTSIVSRSSTSASNLTTEDVSLLSAKSNSVKIVQTENYILKERVGGIPIPKPDFGGFGFHRVGDTQYTSGTRLSVDSNTRLLVPNNMGTNTNDLRFPFDSYNVFHNNKIWPAYVQDVFLIRLSFQISSLMAGNNLKLELDIGSVLQDHRQTFGISAGNPELITVNFFVYALDRFRTNGGSFYLTTNYDSEIWNVSTLFIPVSSGR